MIFTDRTITVRKGESRIDEPIVVYRGDYELEVRFTILNSRFKFMSGTNMIESEKASYGQLAILTPYGGNIFSDIVRCNDGSVTFVLTAEMLNQIEEVGLYSFQIRLMDYNKESRVSIPPIEYGIEVREPIASEDHDNSVNNAIVGYSIAKVVDPKEEKVGDTFDESGNYNKTKWETGDRISEGKLNKIEDAIDKINENEVNNTAVLSRRIDNNFNVLDSILSEIANKGTTVEVLERVTKEEIERQISDGTIANLMIEDGCITKEKLAFKTLTAIPSKNLFNKNNVTIGKYVDYKSGQLLTASGYNASDFIEVEANEVYCKNTTTQFAFYDANKKFISGLNTDRVFTTPSNCRYVRLSVEDSALDSLQFEKGSVQTDYVNFNYNLLDINTVPNKSITKEKLAFSTVELEKSKNLFNKETVTTGYYVDYTSGKLLSNASYSTSDYIEVESDTMYSKVTTYQFAFYDANKKFISGLNTDRVFTTPSNCKFIRISVKNESLDSEMLVENDDVGTYERFGSFIPKDLLPQEILKDDMEYTNFVIVSKDDPQLDTINKALDKLKGVDSVDNPCVILVMPGVYEESLIMAYRYISIIGVDKDTCIITNKLNDYYNPPVDLTPNSHLKNLTIIADNDGIVEIPDVGTPGQQSYAVHFDSAGRYYNSKTEGVSRIENCILISNNYQALGSGLCVNQKLICENVEFRAYKNNNAMRIHNYSLEGGYGSSAVFKDCVFISENGKPIHVQNVNNNNTDTEITFINNVAYNNNGQADCLRHEEVLSDGSISGHIKLGHGSYGNSVPELNK